MNNDDIQEHRLLPYSNAYRARLFQLGLPQRRGVRIWSTDARCNKFVISIYFYFYLIYDTFYYWTFTV